MKLILVQHGDALPKEADPDRALSAQGRDDVGRVAGLLARSGVRAERVFHSGKTRACETADALAAVLLRGGEAASIGGIDPNDPVETFAGTVGHWQDDTMLIGHQPFMGRLVSFLLTADAAIETVAFTPGTAACLERNAEGAWALAWMIRPEFAP